MRNVLKLRGTMLFGKSSMRIGMKVSNRCSCLRVSILLPMKKLLGAPMTGRVTKSSPDLLHITVSFTSLRLCEELAEVM